MLKEKDRIKKSLTGLSMVGMEKEIDLQIDEDLID